MNIAVCWKWVSSSGVSAADRSALEVALRCKERFVGSSITVVSCGGDGAELGLREALAYGDLRAVHVVGDAAAASVEVARCVAPVVAECDLVICGDYSLDRGTGSMPAFLAGLLGRPQALGLIQVDLDDGETFTARRRLDGGRRELLTIRPPAVISVEPAVATLRRASLPGTRAAARTAIVQVEGPKHADDDVVTVSPFRPRPRVVTAPVGATALERVESLTGTGEPARTTDTVTAEPGEAAELIVRTLRGWGYVDESQR